MSIGRYQLSLVISIMLVTSSYLAIGGNLNSLEIRNNSIETDQIHLTAIKESNITYGHPYNIDKFSYFNGSGSITAIWTASIYAGLIKRSEAANGRWIPDLASTMPVFTTITDFTIDLRTDARFGSGSLVTVNDVAFSYKLFVTPLINEYEYSYLSQYLDNSSVVVVDSNTIRFSLIQDPWMALEDLLSVPIFEKVVFETQYNDCIGGIVASCDFDDPSGFYAQGAGPFLLDAIDPLTHRVEVVKNPNYYGYNNVTLDRIIFQRYTTTDEVMNAYTSGEVDIIDQSYSLTSVNASTLGASYKLTGWNIQEVMLNQVHPYYGDGSAVPDGDSSDDKKDARLIRQAISRIVNRTYISDDLMSADSQPISVPISPNSLVYDNNLQTHQFNVSKSKELMIQAGFDYSSLLDSNADGIFETFFFNITYLTPSSVQERVDWSNYIAGELPKMGIGVSLVNVTGWAGIFERVFSYGGGNIPPPIYSGGGYDMLSVGWTNSYDWRLGLNYRTEGLCGTGTCSNFYNYSNSTYDTLSKQYNDSKTYNEKRDAAYAIQLVLSQDLPSIPLVASMSTTIYRNDLVNLNFLIWRDDAEWERVYQVDRVFQMVSQSIEDPGFTEKVKISIDVLNASDIIDVQLEYWNTSTSNIAMMRSGDLWSATIPAHEAYTVVNYKLILTNRWMMTFESPIFSYSVLDIEYDIPQFKSVVVDPSAPTPLDTIKVSVWVNDTSQITSVSITYSYSTVETTDQMSFEIIDGFEKWTITLGSFLNNTSVDYSFSAIDKYDNMADSEIYNFFVTSVPPPPKPPEGTTTSPSNEETSPKKPTSTQGEDPIQNVDEPAINLPFSMASTVLALFSLPIANRYGRRRRNKK